MTNYIQSFVLDQPTNISSIFASYLEAPDSELLENPEEMYPRYYIDNDAIRKFKSLRYRYDPSRKG